MFTKTIVINTYSSCDQSNMKSIKSSSAAGFVKRIISAITSIAKAKTLAIKTKTSAIKTRMIIFSLLRNKKVLLSSISNKLHALLGNITTTDNDSSNVVDDSKAIVVYNLNAMQSTYDSSNANINGLVVDEDEDEDDEKYPDLRHTLFDLDEDGEEVGGGSVIDLVRNSKEEGGEEFSLEDEIDQVADLFIKRFHRQMRLQKQLSFKMYQDMLQRGT